MTEETELRWRGRSAFLLGFTAILLLALLLIGWGTQAKISGAVIGSGVIEVESNRQVVQHPDGGLVSQIHVRNGDTVLAGDALVTLESDDLISELAILATELCEVSASSIRLKAERDGKDSFNTSLIPVELMCNPDIIAGQLNLFQAQKTSFNKEIALIDEQIKHVQEQIKGVEAQITAVAFQLHSYSEEISSNLKLHEKGLVIHSELLMQQRSEAQLRGQLGQLTALKGQHNSTIASHKLSQTRLTNERRQNALAELRSVEVTRHELIEKVRILKRKLERMELTAPMSGIVFGSTIFTLDSVISREEPLMYIVPQNQPLIAAIKISAQDIDQVYVNQDAILRFSALDQKFTPEVNGEVITVSADAVVNEATGELQYEIQISLSAEELNKLGKQFLVAGMPVDAFIRTTDRTPLSYLAKPLMDYFYRAFRES